MNLVYKGVMGLMASVALSALAVPAYAEFAERPVTIVVGFAAGGGVDVVSRSAAVTLSEVLGQPVNIQNQPGAGGGLAVTALNSASPDGYTIVATTSTTLTFDPHAQDLAFEIDDFEYLAAFGVFPEALIALPSRGWETFADTVEEARATPDGLNYATTTSIDRVVLAAIAEQEEVILRPVPTQGGAEAVSQTLGGHVDFAYSSGAYYAQAEAGELAVLAVLGEERMEGFPDAPTLKDLGYDISSLNMVLFLAPKGIPEEAKEKWIEAFSAAAQSEELLGLLDIRNMGSFVPVGDEISELIYAQSEQFAAILEATE